MNHETGTMRQDAQGVDPTRFDLFSDHLDGIIKAGRILGASYAIAHNGSTVANGYGGLLQLGEQVPMPENPVMRIASVTKAFTATAVLKLMDDGKLRLNQTVSEFIEEFATPSVQSVTIEHLLTHTSGLFPDGGIYWDDENRLSAWELIEPCFQKGDNNWIKAALRTPRRAKPGEEWSYSSFGFSILGEIISRVSGVHCHAYIEQNICKPLGMTETSFTLKPEQVDRLILLTDKPERKEWLQNLKNGIKPEPSSWDQVPSTGGGLFSTTKDLLAFGNMLAYYGTFEGARIISRKAAEKMMTLHADLPSYCWGMGGSHRPFGLGLEMICDAGRIYSNGTVFHEGAGGAAVIADPKEKMAMALFVPMLESWVPEALINAYNLAWSALI